MQRKIFGPALLIPLLFSPDGFAGTGGGPNEWISFLGHFHPLVLHLPIGFLVLAFCFEFLSGYQRFEKLAPATEFTLLLGMWSSVIAAAFGYFLSLEGDYGGQLLSIHQWLGISLAVFSIILYILKRKKAPSLVFKGLMFFLMILMTGTGHYGGMLTHGEDYLTASLPSSAKNMLGMPVEEETAELAITNIEEAGVFADLVKPVLDQKCVKCHNANKMKGELNLETKEAILRGGESGDIFVPGEVTESELINLVHLPLTDERHMPPRGKQQLSDEEIALLEWWVELGADFEGKVAQFPKNEEIDDILASIESRANRVINPVMTMDIDEPDAGDIEEIREKGVYLAKVSGNTPYLHARVDNLGDGLSGVLDRVKQQLIWLNLARSNCSNDDLKDLPEFRNLTKLHLQNTEIDDQVIDYLLSLEYLEYLNLYGTEVSDQGILKLAKLKYLKNLYLWDTKVTAQGVAALQVALPQLYIDRGMDHTNLDTIRLASPLILTEKSLFKEQTKAKIELAFEDVKIYYTLDGSVPNENSNIYKEELVIKNSCVLTAVAKKDGWGDSEPAIMEFIKVKYAINDIKLVNDPAAQYAAQGAGSLADGQKGSTDFRDGKWLGFQGTDMIADIDLGEIAKPGRVIISCLEDLGSYIFFPQNLEVLTSLDGYEFHQASSKEIGIPEQNRPGSLKHFSLNLNGENTRYIRIKAKNVGICPEWHRGAGDKAWVFVDEIVIN